MRREGWEAALAETVAAWRARPFAWGEADCLLFAAASVDALTGSGHFAEHAGRYRTPLGARRRLGGGYDRLIAVLDGMFPRRGVAFARRGDLAFLPDPSDRLFRGSVMVVDLNGRSLLAPGESGLARRSLSAASIAWGVD